MNVYIPLHSGISNDDLDEFTEAIRSLRDSYPGDSICMGGDFNFDPWRYEIRCASGISQSALTHYLRRILSILTPDLLRYPVSRVPTFSENAVTSTIDHWYISSSVSVLNCAPISDISRQHAPLRIHLSIAVPPPTSLIPREGNLVFDSSSLRLVQAQLTILANDLNIAHWNVNQLYNQIVGCFQVYGTQRVRPVSGSLGEQWTSFLSEDEKEILRDLERSNQRLAGLVQSGCASGSDISEFRRYYSLTLSNSKKAAEKRIASYITNRAKGRFACWDLIRRLRSPVETVSMDAFSIAEHFAEVFHDSNEPLILDLNQLGLPPPPDFSCEPFSDEELVAALDKLNGKAATGPQRVSSKYLKHVFKKLETRAPLLLLFNRCLITGSIPLAWGESEVFVLYKGKGLQSLPTNYRFINLNNDFLRLYERLLQLRFDRWLAANRPWGPMQFGFTPRVGTLDALTCLRTLALSFTRHLRIPCYANFLDLKKAFPSINRVASLKALLELGVPYELVQAFASTFSMNSCKLVINGLLTGALPVNKGTKEGGINSPPIFNSAYVTVLQRLNISIFPASPGDLDPNAVYYVVFADDLVLISANLTRLEEETNRLDSELGRLGMCINADKTKWMMFLPISPTYIPPRDSLRLFLGGVELELVQEFTYLGFTLDSYASLDPHVKKREKLMMTAASISGKLMRQLEVTNLRSLRAYFYALVSSQLYGQSCSSFSRECYNRAQKIFLQEAWNLPKSFPIRVACFLLGCEPLEAITLRARLRFLQHLIEGNRTRASLSAMILDRSLLLPRRIGWTHDLGSAVPSIRDLIDLCTVDLFDSEQTGRIFGTLARAMANQLRESLLAGSSNHLVSIFPTLSVPRTFGETLGELSFESARILILFLANLTRFSFLSPRNSPCPFCNETMYSQHFFDCDQYQALGDEPVSWTDFVSMFVQREWMEGISSMFRRLYGWSRRANIFSGHTRHRVDEYFEELEWARRDRIRRAGGMLPPSVQWSVSF